MDKQLEKGEVFQISLQLLVQYQTTNISFLKISNNMESETTLMNFLYSVTLKYIDLSCALNRSFTQDSMGYANQIFDTFHHTIFKYIKFINVTTKFIRKFQVQKTCEAHCARSKFSKFLIFTRKLKIYYWQKQCCFSQRDQLTLLLNKYLPNTWSMRNYNLFARLCFFL